MEIYMFLSLFKKVKCVSIASAVAYFAIFTSAPLNAAVIKASTLSDINGEIVNAVKAIKFKDYAQACSILNSIYDAKPLEKKTSDNRQSRLNIYYLLGQCYAGLGLYEEAQQQLLKVVEEDARSPRPYLDLAMIYQYMGDYDKANEQIDSLRAMDTLDETLKQNVADFASNRPDALQYYISGSFGITSDDNINNAPIVDAITIYDQQFVFNSESRPLSSVGANIGATGQITKLLSNASYVSGQLSLSSTSFSDYSKHNNVVIDVSGAYHSKFWIGEYYVQPRFATVSIGGEAFLNVMGVNAAFTTLLSEKLRLDTKFGYQQLSYSADDNRSVAIIKPEFLLNYRVLDDLLLYGSLGLGIAGANDDIYSYNDISLEFGAEYALFDDLLLSVALRNSSVAYSGEIVGFGLTREDTRTVLSAGGSYNLKGLSELTKRVTIDFGFKSYQNTSNISLFENDRTQAFVLFNVTL